MPFFDQPLPPAMPGRPAYQHDVVTKWTAEIAASDGFVFVTPEYNYGPSAVLKNAIDWVQPEWNPQGAAPPASTQPPLANNRILSADSPPAPHNLYSLLKTHKEKSTSPSGLCRPPRIKKEKEIYAEQN